jgi:hypothetical protein
VLKDNVEGPYLHRPENWLVRQLNDEPKPVYRIRFIGDSYSLSFERLQLRYCSGVWKLVTPCSGKSWGFYRLLNSGLGIFLIGLAFQGLS